MVSAAIIIPTALAFGSVALSKAKEKFQTKQYIDCFICLGIVLTCKLLFVKYLFAIVF